MSKDLEERITLQFALKLVGTNLQHELQKNKVRVDEWEKALGDNIFITILLQVDKLG